MDNLTPITREEMLMNDEPLTPITREEKILAGEDLTPVTRREYFLKKYRHAGGDVMVEGLSVTENGIYTAPEGKAYSPVEVAVPLPENAYLLKEVSGSLVSFNDGADLPMPSFVCNIDAVQDLHGYDGPWVGGAGKNKLPMTLDGLKSANTSGTWSGNNYSYGGILFSVETDSDGNVLGINLTGNASEVIVFTVYTNNTGVFPFENAIYGLSGCNGGSRTKYKLDIIYTKNAQIVPFITNYSSPVDADFSVLSGASSMQTRIVIYEGYGDGTSFKPMIYLKTDEAPTFAPYSNICPISGHTGVEAVISPTTEASAGTTYSVSWQTEAGEVYGGEIDLVSGVLTVTDGYIASYDGEILPSTWISDSDVYAEGTTPTTGAEVVYKLAEAQTYQLTPTQIKSLLGTNNAWCDTGDVDIDYFAKEVTG